MVQNIQQETKTPWLTWIEGATVAGAVGGSIIAAMTQQVLFASVPLSLAAALNIANRQRMKLAIDNLTENSARIEQILMAQINNTQNKFLEEIEVLKTDAEATFKIVMIHIDENCNMTREGLSSLETQIKDLQEKSESAISNQLELLASTAEENACRRALEHDKRGDFKAAIAAYEEALKINASYGEAYMGRGHVYAQAGQKQLAIVDLRTAAKLFFESGDLDKYHEAREFSEKIHHASTLSSSEPAEVAAGVKLAVDELFV